MGARLLTRTLDTDEEKSSMLLVMRVLSIVPLNFKVRDFFTCIFIGY